MYSKEEFLADVKVVQDYLKELEVFHDSNHLSNSLITVEFNIEVIPGGFLCDAFVEKITDNLRMCFDEADFAVTNTDFNSCLSELFFLPTQLAYFTAPDGSEIYPPEESDVFDALFNVLMEYYPKEVV